MICTLFEFIVVYLRPRSLVYLGLPACLPACLPAPPTPRRKYRYSDVVVGLARSNDPENHAGGSVATARASNAGQVKGDDPDKKEYPDPLGW